jgi:S1-C subfamily serine protease
MSVFKKIGKSYLLYSLTIIFSLTAFPPSLWSSETVTLESLQHDIYQLVEKVKPSVVTVSAKFRYTRPEAPPGSPLRGSIEGDENDSIVMTNIGSGIVLDSTHIITSALIVQGSQKITISCSDGSECSGTEVGIDTLTGVAVLQIAKKKLKPVILGHDDYLKSGYLVIIMGNSLGISPAVSLGVVNCIRSDGMIQLAGYMAAGNAGGAIFNADGTFAGLLTALISPGMDEIRSGSSLIGEEGALAYPAREIARRANNIIADRANPEGWIGVTADEWPGRRGWVHVNMVKAGSPAQKAGLRMGDIIIAANEKKFNNGQELANYIKNQGPEKDIKFDVLRGDQTHSFKVRTTERSESSLIPPIFRPNIHSTSLSPTNYGAIKVEFTNPNVRTSPIDEEFLLMRIQSIEQELEVLRAMLQK